MNKLAKLARKPTVKKVFGLFFAALMIVSMALPSFAADGDTSAIPDISSDFDDQVVVLASDAEQAMYEVVETVSNALNITTILKFVVAALSVAIGFFVFWWGTRKVIKIVRKAFASGKVSV